MWPFFLFSHTYKNCYKTRTRYSIALTFGTQKGGIKAHLGTNFGWNTINRQRVMSDYSRQITPICCHAYRVNRVWEEAENRWVNRLTIEPQTFCGLKEIELKTRKIQRKNQQCVTIMQSRLANFYSFYFIIIIITRTASHTTKYIHQRDSPPVRLLGGECIIPKSTQYVTVVAS